MDEVSLANEATYVPALPDIDSRPVITARPLKELLEKEYKWLECVDSNINHTLSKKDFISWGAYHASNGDAPAFRTSSHMLPIFKEPAHSPTTMLHCMNRIVDVTEFLNPGQIPVMVVDQPLYAIAKRLQWKYPDSKIGESRFVVLLGAMHIEKMLWSCAGVNGWTAVDLQQSLRMLVLHHLEVPRAC
jgi:hypothetical protein